MTLQTPPPANDTSGLEDTDSEDELKADYDHRLGGFMRWWTEDKDRHSRDLICKDCEELATHIKDHGGYETHYPKCGSHCGMWD